MRTMAFRFKAAAGAASLALAVAACGGTSATEGDNAGDGAAAAKGEVKGDLDIAWWGGEQRTAKTNAVIDMWKKSHPEVKVAVQNAAFQDYFKKLNVQASSKNLPCVTQMQGRQLNDYTKRKTLRALDDLIESGAIKTTDIPKEVVDAGRGPDGKLYFLPYGAAYDALLVNKTLAEQAGVGLPAEGYDWAAFREWATKAQAKLPKGVSALNMGGSRPNFFIAYTSANSAQLFGEDGKLGFTKEMLTEYWTMWEELRKAGVTITPAANAEEPPSTEQSYLAQGRIMADTSPGNALTPASATLKGTKGDQELTSIPLPSGPQGSGNAIFASGFGIAANCTNIATAASFIDFFTNDLEAGKSFAADNGGPTNSKVLEALIADTSLPELKKHELELYQKVIAAKPPTIVTTRRAVIAPRWRSRNPLIGPP